MYIMVEDGMQIINSDFVERFTIAVKPDAALVLASYTTGDDKKPVTIGRYKDKAEAITALGDLLQGLTLDGAYCYHMPASKYYAEHRKMDARQKRRGGS